MLTVTAEQVRTLAPDAAAARAGERLADRRRWSGVGRTETAAWGLCQGSGSSPYQAAVDLAAPAYKCSCPSRKIPCKHALGLLFLLADGAIDEGQPPEWASSWLDSRETRAAAGAARAERAAEVDPAARAKRIQSREKRVAAGIDELDRWLGDLIRRGLDSVRGEGYRFWDAMAARLVDAQAAGLGRSVRSLGSAASAGEAWPHLLLEGAARLRLLSEAYRFAERLPEQLRADVRAHVGWTIKEDDLQAIDALEDRWLVVGRRVDDTGQVITARTFLLGESSGRFALHLAFGVEAAPPTVVAMPGEAFRATLAFYPSSTPLRAAVRPVLVPDGEVRSVPGSIGVEDALRGYAERLAANPYLGGWPVALRDVVPVIRGDRVILRQDDGAGLPVPASHAPRLLAISGGHPIAVVGEWGGSWFWPLSASTGTRLVGLEAADAGGPTGGPTGRVDGDPEWSRLVSAALLGTERIGGNVAIPERFAGIVEGTDRERAILAAAGILALRRRSGRRAVADEGPLPAAAEDDPRPVLAGLAARLIGVVVVDRPSLLTEALALVRASGRRLPDEWLPEMLTLAEGGAATSAAIADLAGPRAGWLAGQVPYLAGSAIPSLGTDWDPAWDAVRGARQRAALMQAMRGMDRVAARTALMRWLPSVGGDERAAVIEALEEGLGPDDEAFLTDALDDRRIDVRRAAAGLLARLQGSSLTRLVESRAQPLIASQGRVRPSLAVTLPELDGELEAAGFGGKPPTGLGERAWLLRELLAHVRPARWTEWLRADPASIVERALRADEARPLIDGWIEAAGRFGDPTWARALVVEPKVAAVGQLDPVRAVVSLPPEERRSLVAAVAGSVDLAALARLAGTCPSPWPGALVDAVFGALDKLSEAQYPDAAYYELVRTAAVAVPPEREEELALTASHRGEIRPALEGAVETIRLRARIHHAFAALPPI